MNWGRQRLSKGERLERHRHDAAHVTIVLSGAYEEAGDDGRRRAEAGCVIIHLPQHAHTNLVMREAEVLNLPAREGAVDWTFGETDALDEAVRLAEKDALGAFDLLAARMTPSAPLCADWPDLLARRLTEESSVAIGAFAREIGVSREHLCRRFHAVYGASPARFRSENRARRAWNSVLNSAQPLSLIAAGHGFADQAHMARAFRSLYGAPPSRLRRGAHRAPSSATSTARVRT